MSDWDRLLADLYLWSCHLNEVRDGGLTQEAHRARWTEAQDAAFVNLWSAVEACGIDPRDAAMDGHVQYLVDEGLL